MCGLCESGACLRFHKLKRSIAAEINNTQLQQQTPTSNWHCHLLTPLIQISSSQCVKVMQLSIHHHRGITQSQTTILGEMSNHVATPATFKKACTCFGDSGIESSSGTMATNCSIGSSGQTVWEAWDEVQLIHQMILQRQGHLVWMGSQGCIECQRIACFFEEDCGTKVEIQGVA